jgi:glycosyltransferase involved in cell wall biosynthesis
VAFTPGHHEAGGAARRSRLLCEEMARRGWQVRAVTRSATSRRLRIVRTPGLVVVEVPGCGGRRRGALAFLVTSVLLGVPWSVRATALLALQLASPSTAAAVVARLTRRPFVVLGSTTGQLSEVPLVTGRSRGAGLRRSLLGRASAVVGQTEAAAEELSLIAPAAARHVLPTPVESVDPTPLTGDPRVLFTGRFSEEKDLPTLLRAWRDVVLGMPSAQLVLAGAGGEYRSVENEVRRLIAQDEVLRATVELPGWIDDVRPLLARCDVYVFPSRSEGMSNSLVEACAAGRVVVASAIAPNVDVLGADYPLLFPPGDAAALAACLSAALGVEQVRADASHRTARSARGLLLPEVGRRLEEVLLDATHHARRQLPDRVRRG